MELTKEIAMTLPINDGLVIIPDNYAVIGESAFRKRPELIYVIIPKTVTEIKSFAFYRCENLKRLNVELENVSGINLLPNLSKLGSYVFSECKSLPSYDNMEVRIELIRKAMDYIKQEPELNLEFIFDKLIREYIINLRIPLNVNIVFPNFTRDNAIKYADALSSASIDWFEDNNNEGQLKFLEWMMSVEVKQFDNLQCNSNARWKTNFHKNGIEARKLSSGPELDIVNSKVFTKAEELVNLIEDPFEEISKVKKELNSDEVLDNWFKFNV